MNDQRSTMSATSSSVGVERSRRGGRLGALVLVALGFAAAGGALFGDVVADAPRTETPSALAAAATDPGPAPGATTAADPRIDAEVRNWVWETPSSDRRPVGRQDLDELWLPR